MDPTDSTPDELAQAGAVEIGDCRLSLLHVSAGYSRRTCLLPATELSWLSRSLVFQPGSTARSRSMELIMRPVPTRSTIANATSEIYQQAAHDPT